MEERKAGCATRICLVPRVGTGREDMPQLSAKELIMSSGVGFGGEEGQ